MLMRLEMSRGAHEWNPGGDFGISYEAIWVRPKTGSLPPMPTEATEIPQFFESLEAMFRSFEIPADLRAKLLLPFGP